MSNHLAFLVTSIGVILATAAPAQQTMQREGLTSASSPITLLPDNPSGIAQGFGTSVAIDGDTAIVGAPHADIGNGPDQGVAYVFVRQAGVWTLQATLEGGQHSQFGTSVALVGNLAIIGAPSMFTPSITPTASGAAVPFVRIGTTWTPRGVLFPNDAANNDRAGERVATNGATILVGAPGKDNGRGAVYQFGRDVTNSFFGPFKISASDGVDGDNFGSAVAMSGTTAIVGAPAATIGAHTLQGAAYVFTEGVPGGVWAERTKLTASDGTEFDLFGSSAAIEGDLALIGLPGMGAGRPGTVRFFTRSGTSWSQQKLAPPDSAPDDLFGQSVALSGNQALVGALTGPTNGLNGPGAAYLFQQTTTGWQLQHELMPSAKTPDLRFGLSTLR